MHWKVETRLVFISSVAGPPPVLSEVSRGSPMVHLFTVTDRFQMEGRGCVLVPGVSCEPGDPVVRLGDRIRLHMPIGSNLDTTVRGIEHIRYVKMPERIAFPILLPEAITKDDIPLGTAVLLLEEKYEKKATNRAYAMNSGPSWVHIGHRSPAASGLQRYEWTS